MDINEIFKDLGMMIHEQGDMIGKPYGLDFMRCEQATYIRSTCRDLSDKSYCSLFAFWSLWNQKQSLQQTKHHPWYHLKQILFLAPRN